MWMRMSTMFTSSASPNMEKNCFICNVIGIGVDGSFSSDSQNYSLILCQILNVQHLGNNTKILENILYCHPCTQRILNLRDFLEKLEKLEKKVLKEKYLIRLELEKYYQHNFLNKSLNSSDQYKGEILTEMKLSLIKSNLIKIARRKQIGKKVFAKKNDLRIMKNITILKNTQDRIVHNIPKYTIPEEFTSPPILDLIYIDEQKVLSESLPNVKPDSDQIEVTSDNVINSPFNKIELPEASYLYDFHDIKFGTSKEEISHSTDTEVRDPFEGIVPELDFETHSNEIAPVNHLVNSLHEGNIFIHTKETPVIEQDNLQTLQMSEDPTPKNFVCGTCDASFKEYNKLNIHCRTHNEARSSKLMCRNSDRAVERKSNLEKHERMHTDEKPFKCQYCEKTFSYRHDLVIHKHVHSGTRPYKCTNCEKTFAERRNLKVHENRHVRKRNFHCGYCEKSFCTTSDMKRHERAHTGEKPFRCSYCEQAFSFSQTCRDHERVHRGEKPYKCKYCEKTFLKSRYCRDHERTHTGEKPFKCRHCGYACTTLGSRRYHEIRHKNTS